MFRPKKSRYSTFRLIGKDAIWLLAIVICGISVIALAGPRVHSGLALTQGGNIDVLFFVDSSVSTEASDIKPSRLGAIKKAILDLVSSGIFREGDRVTIFTIGGTSHWRMPLSRDIDDLKTKVAELSHPKVYEEESQLDTDFQDLLEYVPVALDKQALFIKDHSFGFNLVQANNNGIAIMLSDGIDTGTGELNSGLNEFKRRKIKIYGVGVGTKSGKELTFAAYDPKNTNGPPLKKKINTILNMKELQNIADRTGGETFVFDSESKHSQLQTFLRDAINANRSDLPRLVYSDKSRDIWWDILAIPVVAMLLIAIWRG
jgi:hypothetical protein